MKQSDFKNTPRNKNVLFQDGRIYFSRDTERQVYFALTVCVSLLAVLSKLGVL